MDIEYFLKQRTGFVRYYYDHAILPFKEIMKAIENEVEPYIPPYSEDGEPPFLTEWLDAQLAIDTVGHTVLSMLSTSIHLFLGEWVKQIENHQQVRIKVNFKKDGGLEECNEIFSQLGIKSATCPANLDIIEQILLVRNRIQHPEWLSTLAVSYSDADLGKYPKPFFVDESVSGNFNSSISASEEKIYEAITQIDLFSTWLNTEYWNSKNT